MVFKLSSRDLAAMGVFAAFVAVSTMILVIRVPATRGYFNVGEIMVYTTALLMGPIVGGFAGGVGSAIADLVLAPAYAPATLVIKSLEGFIVGFLVQRNLFRSKSYWRISTVVAGIILGLIVWQGGTSYLSGITEIDLPPPTLVELLSLPPTSPISVYIPEFLWIVLGVLSFVITVLVGFSVDYRIGWSVIAVMLGGAEMIFGYLIYEYAIIGYGGAILELFVNVGQLIIGLLVAVPLSRSIRRVMQRTRRLQAEAVEAK